MQTILTLKKIIPYRFVFCIVAVFCLYFLYISVTYAQTQQTQFVSLSGIHIEQSKKLSGIFAVNDLQTLINKVFLFAISLGAILAVLQLVRAGWMYMSSGSADKVSGAREIITNVVIGLLLLLSIWLILNQINPYILDLDVLKALRK